MAEPLHLDGRTLKSIFSSPHQFPYEAFWNPKRLCIASKEGDSESPAANVWQCNNIPGIFLSYIFLRFIRLCLMYPPNISSN